MHPRRLAISRNVSVCEENGNKTADYTREVAPTNMCLPPSICCGVVINCESIGILKWIQFSIIGDLLILKQQNRLNKIISQIKTTFAAYLTSMKLKNHLLRHIRELDEIMTALCGSGMSPL